MTKQEFENIIRPLALLPSDQRKLLKSALMNNFDKWQEDRQGTIADVVGQSKQLCQCDNAPTKHFIKNWCDDCEMRIV